MKQNAFLAAAFAQMAASGDLDRMVVIAVDPSRRELEHPPIQFKERRPKNRGPRNRREWWNR